MEEFFALAEQQQQRLFTEKYVMFHFSLCLYFVLKLDNGLSFTQVVNEFFLFSLISGTTLMS